MVRIVHRAKKIREWRRHAWSMRGALAGGAISMDTNDMYKGAGVGGGGGEGTETR